jgi:hypothetical protein
MRYAQTHIDSALPDLVQQVPGRSGPRPAPEDDPLCGLAERTAVRTAPGGNEGGKGRLEERPVDRDFVIPEDAAVDVRYVVQVFDAFARDQLPVQAVLRRGEKRLLAFAGDHVVETFLPGRLPRAYRGMDAAEDDPGSGSGVLDGSGGTQGHVVVHRSSRNADNLG